MPAYAELAHEALESTRDALTREYESFKAKGLALNMARGKPSRAQLDLSMPMLRCIVDVDDCTAEDGTDCRNYGVLDGIPEAKRLMAAMLDDDAEHVMVFGNSSLNIMYDTMARCWMFGTLGHMPWCKLDEVKWLCPCPGYDRHFGVTEAFGITMIPVAMNEDGPDMDEVERLVAEDSSIKGIWCVPKYSNPTGVSYSDETVRRFAHLKPAAKDFRIFWDNAYSIHHLYDDKRDVILELLNECVKAGNPDMVFKFISTSKVSFPGSGIAALAASRANIEDAKSFMKFQTIGHDKLNQLRHVRFFKDMPGMYEHMRKHAAILRPKFEKVEDVLEKEIGGLGIGTWTKPLGGYFISFDSMDGCAKAIVAKAKEAGLIMTGAGATFPYGKDPKDSNIRIAPSFPTVEELAQAAEIFVLSVKLVSVEKLLGAK